MLDLSGVKDPHTLKTVAELLIKENERLNKRIESLEKELAGINQTPISQAAQQELDYVKDLLRQREQELFGASSERRKDPATPAQAATKPGDPKKPRNGHGPTPQPELRAKDVPHELADDERECQHCGGHLVEMGQAEVDSEEIDLVAKEFVRLIHRRKKYHCGCGQTIKVAPGPLKLIPGGRYSIAFTIDVAVAKYLDAMPLARQVRAAARHGIALTTSALWDQLDALATALYPTYLAICAAILDAPVIGADETHWLVMANGKAEVNQKFYVWGINDGRYAAYRILPGRSKDDARKVLGNYGGIVMTDGYEVYQSLANSAKTMKLCGPQDENSFRVVHCWMHVRRKFIEAEGDFPEQSKRAVDLIRSLYLLEREADKAPPEERLAALARIRDERSRPIVEELFAWASKQRVPSANLLGIRRLAVASWWGSLDQGETNLWRSEPEGRRVTS